MNTLSTMEALLSPYQNLIESKIKSALQQMGDKTPLRDACEYALLSGGKRFRPAITMIVANALGNALDVSEAALAIECFHTASLVADDLPCMDDDDERRQKPSLHKVYGEAMTLLVSYALIARGYECVAKNTIILRRFGSFADRYGTLALENATFNTGILGATGGQFLDIYLPNRNIEMLRKVIHEKTVSLFEIAFVFGWLFGGGEETKLDLVKKAASHFGMAFQIGDDIGDSDQDMKNPTTANVAVILGKEKAVAMFHEELQGYQAVLKRLELDSKELESLGEALLEAFSPQRH